MLHEYEMFGCLELTEELPKYGKTAWYWNVDY